MKVVKIFNNSVVLGADGNGQEAVLLGAGLGFALKVGMNIDPARIERTFLPENAASIERLVQYAQEIPLSDIELTEEILLEASQALHIRTPDQLLLPLADHITFALSRARTGVGEIDYPLRWEVQQLYPDELAVARTAIAIIASRTGVFLPSVEAVPIALHFVNAHVGATDVTTTMRMTTVLSEALDTVRRHLDMDIDEDSLAVSRLVTHLRYLFLRQQRGTMSQSGQVALDAEIRGALPREYECARAVSQLLADRWGTPVTSEETLYLTLHIGRLSATLRHRDDDEPPRIEPNPTTTAESILRHVGGPSNVTHLTHCMSRLRMTVDDGLAVDERGIEALDDVALVLWQSGQLHIAMRRKLDVAYKDLACAVGMHTVMSPRPDPSGDTA
ncbi:PRD domain-containing protein [Leifsonia poae]|uniref:Transcriptional antiterminator n=1 Tax=Leifsonia poae TaxID=110933 RepID=A0A9W6HBR4_9MICO|nr:PRD domain-containing protein [Leifsonia poae]GLJ77377.1 hypothetical protein GCM10017584_29510 [Leifsonia poae]